MLKALELFGFKSFADRTRFEFPEGITVVVGPNGSGKSNIVDAIKWVLGERSAKSLRGQEMADVIFKGSGLHGRKPMNTAEATLLFDNTDRRLPIDADEVQVTRRIYRSGEGEYLINGQACRLRDLKDTFRGTGIGTDAYSLIEQGKVDTLLSAGAKDRRAIFEEAAGISRFKSKKVETQRRLERVDQHLLRLSDIVEEVENRLRNIRSQATKAQRYREYTQRLQQLRTQVGMADWRRFKQQSKALRDELVELHDTSAAVAAQIEAVEARLLEQESQFSILDEQIRTLEGRSSRNRETIVSLETSLAHQRGRLVDLEEEIQRHRQQYFAMNHRAGDLRSLLQSTEKALDEAQREHLRLTEQSRQKEARLEELGRQLTTLRDENQSARATLMQQMRRAAQLESEAARFKSQIGSASATLDRCEKLSGEVEQKLQAVTTEHAEMQSRGATLAEEFQHADAQAKIAADERRRLAGRVSQCRENLARAEAEMAGLRQRVEVLEELERRHEGLDDGVKDLLARAEEQPDGPLGDIRGMVADLIRVNVESAPLIDLALGPKSQHLVVAGERFLEYLQGDECLPAGRVGVQWLECPWRETSVPKLDGRPGVIGRADRFVQADPAYQGLVERLLGNTWLVARLSDALTLSASTGRGCRFATTAGELVESDGTIVVGPRGIGGGLVSRRSRLRQLHRDIEQLDERIVAFREELEQARESLAHQEAETERFEQEQKKAEAALSRHRVEMHTVSARLEDTARRRESLAGEIAAARQQKESAQEQLDRAEQDRAALETHNTALQEQLHRAEEQLAELEEEKKHCNDEATAAKVQRAKSEQRLEGLRRQAEQVRKDQSERTASIAEVHARMVQARGRLREATREVLDDTSRLAVYYLEKESFDAEIRSLLSAREQCAEQRSTCAHELAEVRRRAHAIEEKVHKKELENERVLHEQATLIERLREDYGLEPADLEKPSASAEEEQQREQADEEIAELRKKIAGIGAVNMEALDELDQLESRFASLSGQYQDLVSAKQSLEKIITRINGDSRRLFTETLEVIRTNFRAMFRKVFGGGHADIVLEEGVDILDAGIEIIATPPGKQSLSISLLSGGERALTAVTLLLAIFEYRPSPFCVLDEVDGPLDEANIGRFVEVLEGFLAWTKFVIVTHSKKTMTAATTLYGVTMQESGVSKRVSVCFEDVSDDGHISHEALHRDEQQDRRAA